jgi:hypothetical protein
LKDVAAMSSYVYVRFHVRLFKITIFIFNSWNLVCISIRCQRHFFQHIKNLVFSFSCDDRSIIIMIHASPDLRKNNHVGHLLEFVVCWSLCGDDSDALYLLVLMLILGHVFLKLVKKKLIIYVTGSS